jgi:type I restriction enzyme S subunit
MKPGYKQTEVGVIPEEWEVKRLGELAALRNGYAFKSDTYTTLGNFKVITIANVQDGYMTARECNSIAFEPKDLQSHQRLQIGDILISMTGNVGRVCRVTEKDCLLNQRVGKLIPTAVDDDMLFILLGQPSFIKAMTGVAKGGAQPNLSVSEISDHRFCVPKTLPEQRAIATALSDVDGLLGGLDRLIAKKRDLKQAAMQQLLTGQTRLPGFHGEWQVKRLGEVLKVRHGKSQHGITAPDGKYPILASGGEIGRTNAYIYDQPSVLIGRKGTIDSPQYVDSPFWTVDTLFFTEIASEADAKFVFYKFTMIRWRSYNEASGVPSLNAKTIENIEVTMPPLPEQTAIASVLSEMDGELAVLEQRREKTRALKQAMMQELLTGRTRLI